MSKRPITPFSRLFHRRQIAREFSWLNPWLPTEPGDTRQTDPWHAINIARRGYWRGRIEN